MESEAAIGVVGVEVVVKRDEEPAVQAKVPAERQVSYFSFSRS